MDDAGRTRCAWQARDRQRNGFTLLEILTVVLIVGVIITLSLSSLSRAKQSARSAQCIGNLHQLGLAFEMFGLDNQFYPSNNFIKIVDYFTVPNGTWAPLGMVAPSSDIRFVGGCFEYYLPNTRVFRCPSDRRRMTNQPASETLVQFLHSYNLSIWINCEGQSRSYHTESEISHAERGLSEIFTFIDTHEHSIVDPAFGVFQRDSPLYRNIWVDLPSDRHMRGANVAFMDLHIVPQRWKAPKVFEKHGQKANPGPDLDDLQSLQRYVPRPNPL